MIWKFKVVNFHSIYYKYFPMSVVCTWKLVFPKFKQLLYYASLEHLKPFVDIMNITGMDKIYYILLLTPVVYSSEVEVSIDPESITKPLGSSVSLTCIVVRPFIFLNVNLYILRFTDVLFMNQ